MSKSSFEFDRKRTCKKKSFLLIAILTETKADKNSNLAGDNNENSKSDNIYYMNEYEMIII